MCAASSAPLRMPHCGTVGPASGAITSVAFGNSAAAGTPDTQALAAERGKTPSALSNKEPSTAQSVARRAHTQLVALMKCPRNVTTFGQLAPAPSGVRRRTALA